MRKMSETQKDNLRHKAYARAKSRNPQNVIVVQDKRVRVRYERGNKKDSVLVRIEFTKADDRWLWRYLQTAETVNAGDILRKRFKIRRYHKMLNQSHAVMCIRSTAERCGFVATDEKIPMMGFSYVVYRKPDRFEALLA